MKHQAMKTLTSGYEMGQNFRKQFKGLRTLLIASLVMDVIILVLLFFK